jgi:hypothetical protein
MDKPRSPSSGYITELERMIGRAEGACERYRQATTKLGLSPPVLRRRVRSLNTMQDTLVRLLAQRDARLR